MQIDWDVPIEMEDGAVLRADIFRPAGAGRSPGFIDPFGRVGLNGISYFGTI